MWLLVIFIMWWLWVWSSLWRFHFPLTVGSRLSSLHQLGAQSLSWVWPSMEAHAAWYGRKPCMFEWIVWRCWRDHQRPPFLEGWVRFHLLYCLKLKITDYWLYNKSSNLIQLDDPLCSWTYILFPLGFFLLRNATAVLKYILCDMVCRNGTFWMYIVISICISTSWWSFRIVPVRDTEFAPASDFICTLFPIDYLSMCSIIHSQFTIWYEILV